MNFAARVELHARNDPDAPAIHFGDETLTWGDLDARTDGFAATLRACGIGTGDAVALLAPNVPEFVVGFYGAMKAGAVAMPMNTGFAPGQVQYMLDHVGHRALVTLDRFADVVGSVDLGGVEHAFVAGDSTPSLEGPEAHDFAAASEPGSFDTVPRREADHAFYMHTSGTTGRPKPVVATHGNVRTHALAYADKIALSRNDVALNTIPIFHVGGLNLHLTLFTELGAPQVLVDGWDPEAALAAVEAHGVTYGFLIATMLYDLANRDRDAPAYDTDSLRVVGVGGQNVPPAVVERFEARYSGTVLEAYGLTETMPAVLSNEPGDRRPGTAGTPIENAASLRIGDPEDPEREVETGDLGELLVSGDVVTPGYLDRPDANEAAFETVDGTRWLHTGDVVAADEEGYVSIEDRIDDMIITGGENVYPSEVEAVVYELDGVEEVAVIGTPDERFGERVTAIVVASDPSLTAEDVTEHCEASGRVADYAKPREVHFVDELPRSGAGKIDRVAIEERYAE